MTTQLCSFLILFTGFIASFLVGYSVYYDIDRKNTLLKKRISRSVLYRMNTEQLHSYYSITPKSKKYNSFKSKQNQTSIIEKIEILLARADIKTDVSTIIIISLVFCLLVWTFFLLKQKGIITSLFLTIGITGFLFYRILTFLINRKKSAFTKGFSEGLDIMVRSIKAGFSVNRSIGLIAQEGQDPIKSEFQTITEQLNAGQSLEKTLLKASTRIDLQSFRFFCVCILIQNETGGNLSEALSNLIQVLRKRQEMSLKIKALSSEARASAIIVGSLPFIAALALSLFNPAHIAVFYNTASGQRWLTIMLVLLSMGIMIIRKLIRFKV